MNCKICLHPMTAFGKATILGKYAASYFRCQGCGFIQIEDPTWLEEAYSHAMSNLDVGIMQRNLANVEITSAAITLLMPKSKSYLDYGGGHGTFVRMMRDRGFDFRWSDVYAENFHARGFERGDESHFDLLTSFEVLEHLTDPLTEISKMMSLADDVLVSTLLLPHPPLQPNHWWYYALNSGQHISFYSSATLQVIADKFGRHMVSSGGLHLFSRIPRSRAVFQLATWSRSAKVINALITRKSLTAGDFSRFSD